MILIGPPALMEEHRFSTLLKPDIINIPLRERSKKAICSYLRRKV
jgi:hypothetical protein